MLRDLVLLACVFACLGMTFRHAFAGVLTWTWIALMQPYTEVYGPISHALRINLMVVVVTLLAWLVSRERKLPPANPTISALVVFLAWMTFNQFFAVKPDSAWQQWDRNWRIIALGFAVWAMANSRVRVHALIWVVVASFLYYGVKSGTLTVLAGGVKKTMGPSNGMYADNNQFAVALLMILPLINYLRVHSQNRSVRIGLAAGFVLTVFAIVGSYSRGAFVGLAVLGLVWWFRERNKFVYLAMAVAVAYPVFHFMPQSYYTRIDTIENASRDGSFQGRVTAWKVAYYYARDHFPLGAGFDGPQQPEVFNHYFPSEDFHAAHSIYFQVLGDLGFIGLAIYLTIIILVFGYCSRIRWTTRSRSELRWARDLATAIQLSMVAFCIAGAALSLAYADFTFIWAGLLPGLWQLVRKPEKAQLNLPASDQRRFAPVARIHPAGLG